MTLALLLTTLALATQDGVGVYPVESRQPLPDLPVLTGTQPQDTLDPADFAGWIVVINAWYEY
jgi:hypothetical protein